MSTTEEKNKAVVARLIDAWNRDDLAALMTHWAPEMVHHARDGVLDAATVGAEMGRFMRAFRKIRMEVHSVVAEGDLVATRFTVHARHDGDYLGVPATHRQIRCALMGQLRIVDGLVVEHWGVADGLHLLEQLGLLPEQYLSATA
ncbi:MULTISPECIES: ester cyclase [Micromonospora]|uniref:Predicted ester cyclase n=1 Tax=Micromonospora yangpuensis TaxID=683228 RepID=A0A1C6UUE0_9ACTN|nr:ester cyclase [Micromonospora yangpuensis]GGM24279.1 hypothetical protein GCM10012279_48300 [Micromonospora yangpuensis]SCL57586.1 Predicted ester cyclase [Micromonospora yangpuensis]